MDDLLVQIERMQNRIFSPTLAKMMFVLWTMRERSVSTGFEHAEPRDVLPRVRGLTSEEGLKRLVEVGDVDRAMTIWWAFSSLRVALGLRGSEVERRTVSKRPGPEPSALEICVLGLERMGRNGWAFLQKCSIDPRSIDLHSESP